MKMQDWSAIRLRINEVDDGVRDALSRVCSRMTVHLPLILEDFYRFMAEYEPSIARIRDPGFIRESISLHLAHWKLIGGSTFGDELARSAAAICELHKKEGLFPQWYIGSRIMFLSTSMRSLLLREFPAASPGRRRQPAPDDIAMLMEALVKASFLDLEMTVGIYFGTARQVRKSAIETSSVRFKEMIAKLSSASIALEGAARKLSDNAENTTRLGGVVAKASEDASSDVQSVASAAELLAASVRNISLQVQQSSSMAQSAVAQADQADSRISALAHAAGRIGDVVKLIDSVAGQTNLLALNATIEAARAGETGRGFAIVAQEVKTLAAQTGKATGEIGKQISDMQVATSDAVSFIRIIDGNIGEISAIAAAIASAVKKQDSATNEIVRNIRSAAVGTAQVAESVAQVRVDATETRRTSAHLLDAARTLSEDSASLQSAIDDFLSLIAATG
jgi:methyl-accepting chemotaxis protein